jgi:hypothetical protein
MSNILGLLATRHSKDVFVPECKVGPSAYCGSPRLDAWAMACSWTSPRTWGYEIKLTRSDFFGDEKWQNYLPYCNQLFFVVPWGLVRPEEVPGGCGLLWASSNLTRLYSKRKAEHREIEEPVELLKSVLMRLDATRDEDSAAYWARELANKKSRTIGQKVAKQIAKTATAEICQIRKDNKQLRAENKRLAAAKRIFESLGITSDTYVYNMRRQVERSLALLNGGSLAQHLQNVEQACARAREQLAEQVSGSER